MFEFLVFCVIIAVALFFGQMIIGLIFYLIAAIIGVIGWVGGAIIDKFKGEN